ncbi:MAG: hypothetical protein GXP55_24845 [Deltaproteobacteria bacterium]|nr:hypothetical protein [Deltaproteobacteria bacterium]
MDSRITEHPETVCGPFGCYQESRLTEYQVPVLSMDLEVVVHDGPSAAELARFSLHAQEEGREFAELRVRASAELTRRLMAMIDPEARTLHARLLPVPDADAERALAFAAKGRLADARRELRGLIRSDALAALEERSRAAVFYDLAQLLRFDPEAPRDAPARARRLLQRAVRLDPRSRYDRALRDLAEDERRAATLQDQRSAAAHNFALGRGETRGEAGAPTPPAGYR